MRLPSDATLLVVDAGVAVAAPASPGLPADAAARMRILLDVWRDVGLPVMMVDGEHAGTRLEGTRQISRVAASAFVGTDLDEFFTARGCTTLVVCGFGTDAGVEATVRHAADLGFRLFVVADACAGEGCTDLARKAWPADDIQALALTRMARAGAAIVDWRTAWIAAKGAGWGRKS